MTFDPLSAPATELARRVRAGEASSVEIVEAHLARIAEVNPRINAVVQIAPDALDLARDADAAVASGEALGPFHGVPFTVKDWIETEGLVCAAGFAERADFRPARDATVVARMRRAGAILLGKTNVTDGAPVHARQNNPHDAARTPGSSSSGEAAIIAAGGSPMGLASDSGGSIRWPAHCCGVAALKPTTGRVPNTGHFPRIGHLSDPRTTIGPMARSAADLGVLLQVIAGQDGRDPGTVPVALGDPKAVTPSELRVGWFTDLPGARPTQETVQAVRDAALAMSDRGCVVAQVSPPGLNQSWAITRVYWARARSMSLADWRPAPEGRLSAAEIEESVFEWERFARGMTVFMAGHDVLISPAASGPAPLHDQWGLKDFLYTLPYSLTGQPVAVVPFGTSAEGLPIGVQIAAGAWRDHLAIAVAVALEEAIRPV